MWPKAVRNSAADPLPDLDRKNRVRLFLPNATQIIWKRRNQWNFPSLDPAACHVVDRFFSAVRLHVSVPTSICKKPISEACLSLFVKIMYLQLPVLLDVNLQYDYMKFCCLAWIRLG